MDAIKFLNQELSWDSLDKKLKDLTTSKQTKKAGDIFETVVKYYLLANSKYKSTLINVWLLEEVPAAVKLKLNLPNSDEGIDLIAETKNGHFWAVQAKYRSDPNETLTIGGKGSLATFNNLAFGYCKNISHEYPSNDQLITNIVKYQYRPNCRIYTIHRCCRYF